MSEPTRQCLACHYWFSPDDVVVESGTHSAICLRCYAAEVGTLRPVPTLMEREIVAVLEGLSAWIPD